MKAVTDFISVDSKITADGDCSCGKKKKKRHLVLERTAMNNLDSILKIRDITLPTKVCIIKPMFFPEVMSGCESWDHKKS